MSAPNFLFVPSKLATVNQGRLLEVLGKVGNVYQTAGSAQQTIARLREQGVLPEDPDDDDEAETVEFFVVVAPPPPFTPRVGTGKDVQKVNVGRGIYDTIQELSDLSIADVVDVLFVADNPTLTGQAYADALRIKLTEYVEGDVIDRDWKTAYAEYPTENECLTWEDVCDLKEFDALSSSEVTIDRSKVVCADSDAFPGGQVTISGSTRRLLVARHMGLI